MKPRDHLILRLTNLTLIAALIATALGLITACGGTGSASSGSTAANPVNTQGQRVLGGKTVSAALDTSKSTSTLTGSTFSGVVSIGQPLSQFQ